MVGEAVDVSVKGKSVGRGAQGFGTTGISNRHSDGGVSCYGRDVGGICRRLFSRTLGGFGRERAETSHHVSGCCRGVHGSGRRGPFCRTIIRVKGGRSVDTVNSGTRLSGRVVSRCFDNFGRQGPCLQIFSTRLRLSRTAPRLRVSFMPFAAKDGHNLRAEMSLGRTLTTRNFGNNDHNSAR